MTNLYPKECGICKVWVSAGEGTVYGSRTSGWTVTHNECPRGSVEHGHASAYAHRVIAVLKRRSPDPLDVVRSLDGLAALMRAGWTSRKNFEEKILQAPAFMDLDRLEVEEILNRYLTQEGTRC